MGLLLVFLILSPLSAEEIVIGAATSLTYLEGRESLKAVELAVAEINASGGVRIGSRHCPVRIAKMDLKGACRKFRLIRP